MLKKIFILMTLPFLLVSCATESKIPLNGVDPYLQLPKPPYDNLPQPAFEIRFNPEKKGNYAETYFEVPDRLSGRQFSFLLSNYYSDDFDNKQRAKLNALLGDINVDSNGIPKTPGVIRHVRLRIYSVNGEGEELIHDKVPYVHLTGGGGAGLKKGSGVLDQIFEFKILNKGIYKVRVDAVKDTPQLADVFITFKMSYYAKP